MNIIIKQSDKKVLSLDTLKAHLRIDHEHEDTYLDNIINMATELLEANIEDSILEKTYKYTYYSDELYTSKKIYLPIKNVKEIISVKKILNDSSSEKISFSNGNSSGKTYISTNGSKYPIEIQYKAGMTKNDSEVPNDLKYAILHISTHIYECSNENILDSKIIKYVTDSYKYPSIN